MNSNRKSKKPLLVIFALGAMFLTLAGRYLPPDDVLPQPPKSYLERQTLALLPDFRGDVDRLGDAPQYTLTATVQPSSHTVRGEMSVRYTHRGANPVDTLAFRLYPNAETVYGGGGLEVASVALDERPLSTELSQGRTVLWVSLDVPLAFGDAVTLALSFEAQIPDGSFHGHGIFNEARGLFSLAGWYPILAPYDDGAWVVTPVPAMGDAMLAETSFYEVFITTPDEYQVVGTGVLLGRQRENAQTTWHMVSGPAREFTVALSERLNVLARKVGNVTLRLYTLPAANPVTSEKEALDMAAAILRIYSEVWGPYRFTELDVVHAVVPLGGYEFPGLVYVEADERVSEPTYSYEFLLAHEIAHQWWYAQISGHTVDEPWLDEGMANYSTVLYEAYHYGIPLSATDLAYWRWQNGTRGPGDPPLNSSALDFERWSTYRRTIYIHSAFFIHELHEALGNTTFFEFARQFQETYRYRYVSTGEFLGAAQEATTQDLSPLFERWFDLRTIALPDQAPDGRAFR